MARTRLLDQKPQMRKADGTLAALGTVYFYETGTTTPKSVYNAPTGGSDLGASIGIDMDGRWSEDVWLNDDAAYRIDVKDSGGASIPGYPLDNVGSVADGSANIPDPATGAVDQVWSADGVGGADWRDVNEVPDSTGHSTSEVLYSDNAGGSNWGPLPTDAEVPPLPDEGVTETTPGQDITVGTTRILNGNDTAPTNSTIRVTKSVVFGTAFGATPKVFIAPTIGSVTGDTPSADVSFAVTARSTTGFTVEFFAGAENNGGNTNITTPVTFDWFAMGTAA